MAFIQANPVNQYKNNLYISEDYGHIHKQIKKQKFYKKIFKYSKVILSKIFFFLILIFFSKIVFI